jgi:hypothetical protein
MSKALINQYYSEVDKLIRYGGSRKETSIRRAPVCGRFQRKRIYRIWFASLRLACKCVSKKGGYIICRELFILLVKKRESLLEVQFL